MVNLMNFFESGGFTKLAPIIWFEWFLTVQSDFFDYTPILTH